jgi:hypothetical protein
LLLEDFLVVKLQIAVGGVLLTQAGISLAQQIAHIYQMGNDKTQFV